MDFSSRRSTVYSTQGIVSSSQPLANQAGAQILAQGGNCVDAAIAVSAALCVTEPASTGIGGDCFALYYTNKTVLGINGSGRAAAALDVDYVQEMHPGCKRIPFTSVLGTTVPGAISGWYEAYSAWGSKKVTFAQILAPAISLAEHGFPVSHVASVLWTNSYEKLMQQEKLMKEKLSSEKLKQKLSSEKLKQKLSSEKLKQDNLSSDLDVSEKSNPFLVPFQNGSVQEGTLVFNRPFAKALSLIAEKGPSAFYSGPIAEAIVSTTSALGHKLEMSDLNNHTSSHVDPISYNFQGYDVWEIPPNGHGLVALVALGVIQTLHEQGKIDLYKMQRNSPEYLHLLIEACKIGFHDSDHHVADMEHHQIDLEYVLGKEHLAKKAALFSPDKIIGSDVIAEPVPDPKFACDTVYLAVSDSNGESCSFINSVYESFGNGIVVPEYGFALQNRGSNFNLTHGQPNCLKGGKRPYHTIIPGMITKNGEMFAAFGNMGGFAQPVCHVQHVLNLIVFGLDPQQSVDSPRFVLMADKPETDRGRGGNGPVSTPVTIVALEGTLEESCGYLRALGHEVVYLEGEERSTFGRAQIITRREEEGGFVYAGGSDPRGDGASIPFT